MGSSNTQELSLGAPWSPLEYHLVTRWHLDATADETVSVLRQPQRFGEWWGGVFLDTTVLRPGGKGEVGTRVAVLTRGWMPYCLRFTFEITESHPPDGFTIEVWGDFEGVCRVEVADDAPGLGMTFDWRCRVTRPLLRGLSLFLHPFCVSNHRWTMRRGCRSLQREIDRRREEVESKPTERGPVGALGGWEPEGR